MTQSCTMLRDYDSGEIPPGIHKDAILVCPFSALGFPNEDKERFPACNNEPGDI